MEYENGIFILESYIIIKYWRKFIRIRRETLAFCCFRRYNTAMKLHDSDIRPLLFDYLDGIYGKVRTYEELMIHDSRADVLAVVQGALIGLEIKSDADTYARLAAQVKDYDRFCDLNYLVVGSSHAQHAAEHIPQHWGLLAADGEKITELRGAQANQKAKLLWQLRRLWKRELWDLLDRNGLPKYRDKRRKFICEKLLEKLEEATLKEQLCDVLFERDYTVFEETDSAPRVRPRHHKSAAARRRAGARRALRKKQG